VFIREKLWKTKTTDSHLLHKNTDYIHKLTWCPKFWFPTCYTTKLWDLSSKFWTKLHTYRSKLLRIVTAIFLQTYIPFLSPNQQDRST